MRKKTVRKNIILFSLFSLLSLSADQSIILYQEASEALLWGKWEEAEEKYRRAADISSGEFQQICTLKSLQIRFDMGHYSLLLEEAAELAAQGLTQNIKRDSLIVEFKAMAKLGQYDQARQIISMYDDFFNRDTIWLLACWELYNSLNMIKEADRAGWIIRQYFPKSPEALILTGETKSSTKPSLFLYRKEN